MSWLQAYRWWCEDYVCDCTQYVIEELTPHPVTRGSVNRKRLWSGTFRTDSADLTKAERAADLREFRNAARRWGVRLHRQRPLGSWAGDSGRLRPGA